MSQLRITDSGSFEFTFSDLAEVVDENKQVCQRVLFDAIKAEIACLDSPCQSVVKKSLLRVWFRYTQEMK